MTREDRLDFMAVRLTIAMDQAKRHCRTRDYAGQGGRRAANEVWLWLPPWLPTSLVARRRSETPEGVQARHPAPHRYSQLALQRVVPQLPHPEEAFKCGCGRNPQTTSGAAIRNTRNLADYEHGLRITSRRYSCEPARRGPRWFCLAAVAVLAMVVSGSTVPVIELGLVGLALDCVNKGLRR